RLQWRLFKTIRGASTGLFHQNPEKGPAVHIRDYIARAWRNARARACWRGCRRSAVQRSQPRSRWLKHVARAVHASHSFYTLLSLHFHCDEFAERETFERAYFGAIAAAQELLSRHATVGPASGADFASVPGSEVAKLQKRSKWRRDGGQPQIGEMVLIKDDRLPPNRWLLGRVTAVFPGADGVNRVAHVYTSSGTMRRAYNRLCPLPTLEPDVPRAAVC
ncbi:uncharacterized protein LOC114366764, partial [Ostrinia furnacalis]|uniref:uncharacterized protein LOC114366764 n=1 Tax=Ostrinia furnacalis TaxID=93504 RepID=UPI00104007D8